MSIDAQVQQVILDENGSGRLLLIDRPKGNSFPGCAGQKNLYFHEHPIFVKNLAGKLIWGNDRVIMLGDKEIALRVTFAEILFCDDEKFNLAIREYSIPKNERRSMNIAECVEIILEEMKQKGWRLAFNEGEKSQCAEMIMNRIMDYQIKTEWPFIENLCENLTEMRTLCYPGMSNLSLSEKMKRIRELNDLCISLATGVEQPIVVETK